MSEMNPDDFDSITENEVREFIGEKKIRTTCAECGHQQVGLSTERNGLTPSISSLSVKKPEVGGSYVNFYWQLVCLNCGHLRMFEKSEVLRWKIKRAENVGNQS